MKTFIKDTEAEKEGDKVNVIFLILASSDYFGVSRKSRLGTSFGKRPLLLDFQIVDFGRKHALRTPTFFAILKHLEWGGPSRDGPTVSGIKF